MRRFDQRQGFLVSAAIHLALLMILIAHPPSPRPAREDVDPATLERKDLVFLPPAAVIRQLVPRPSPSGSPRAPSPPPAARSTPPPPDASGKDRISVGPRMPVRNEGPLNLESIGKVPKGTQTEQLTARATATPAPPSPPAAPTPAPRVADASRGAGETMGPPAPGPSGLRLPPGLLGRTPQGAEGRPPTPGIDGDTVDRAVQEAARRAADGGGGAFGRPDGTASDISGLQFDPQGADFTVWLSHLRNEFWRNFVVPQTAYLGFRGRVVTRFTVERNGDVSAIDTVQSSGTASLDRSVANAVSGSRYLPLPSDYRPARITFHLIFEYR